jgi:hypothetical protein
MLIGLGLYFLVREYWPGIDFNRLWPLGLGALAQPAPVVAPESLHRNHGAAQAVGD